MSKEDRGPARSQYRDDLEAAHERIRALEREVSDLRGPDTEAVEEAAAGAPAARPAPGRGGAALVAFGVVLLVALLFVALVSRRPQVFILIPPALLAFAVMIMLGRLVHVIRPCELLVLSGRQRKLASGDTVGFRAMTGGRVMALPFLETAHRMDLRARCVDVSVEGAYTAGGVPVTTEGFCVCAIDPGRHEAIERFLGRDGEELETVARETLEGCMRTTLATEDRGKLQSDPGRFRRVCMEEASAEYAKLGLQLLDLHLLAVRATDRGAD